MDIKKLTDEELTKEYHHAVYMQNQMNTQQMVSKILINSLK